MASGGMASLPAASALPPLRILCFLHSFEPGGVERVALRLCAAWDGDDATVTVALGRRDGAMAADAPALNYLVPSSGGFSTAWFETLWMILTLPRAIRQARPDILFCAGNTYSIVAVAMKLLLGKRCPPIVAKISNDLDRADQPRWFRWLYRRWCRVQGRFIDHFVATAEPVLAEIARAMGTDAGRMSVVPNPVLTRGDLDRLAAAHDARAQSAKGQGRRFLAAGRLVGQKDFASALRAFARGAEPEDRLTIVGEGPDRPALERMVRQLGLEHRVSLPGHSRSMSLAFANSDVFLLSSRYEGVPGVIIEALAAGLPIVATDCCVAMAPLLRNGQLGRLVQRGDIAALSVAIREARPGSQAVQLAYAQAGRFTVERASSAYIGIMSALAGERAKGS